MFFPPTGYIDEWMIIHTQWLIRQIELFTRFSKQGVERMLLVLVYILIPIKAILIAVFSFQEKEIFFFIAGFCFMFFDLETYKLRLYLFRIHNLPTNTALIDREITLYQKKRIGTLLMYTSLIFVFCIILSCNLVQDKIIRILATCFVLDSLLLMLLDYLRCTTTLKTD